ncbi:hypothetical protein EC991_008673 [Linnemannia zychae]|nr:hypothetical protein EC991_008673 [Linnemannia zychae]
MASASSPSFPPTSSLSSRRPFTPAPLTSTLNSSTRPLSTITINTPTTTTTSSTDSRRHSQLLLDQALPTPRLPLSTNPSSTHRPISAYFADFSAECGAASPYTSEPVCVLPHLYLGAEHNATDIKVLSRLGITAVLNVAVEITQQEQQQQQQQQLLQLPGRKPTGGDRVVLDPHSGSSIHYKSLSWTHHQRNLRSEFPSAFDYIEEAKTRGGKVLVHCQLGVSRSASLVIAYVMKTLQMGLTDAYELVKSRSAVISPNMSLMYQLSEFEKSLNTNSSKTTINKSPMYMDEDEEEYPYPTERMDIDGDETPASSPIVAVSAATPKTPKTPKAFLPPVTTRPRSSHYLSSAPIPQTPMTDRFSFSSFGPSPSSVTPVTASTSTPSSVSNSTTTTTTTIGLVPKTRLQLQPTTPTTPRYSSQPLQPIQQYPEGVSIHNTRGPNMVYTPLSALSNPTPVVPSTPIGLSPPMPAFATTPTSTGFSSRRQQQPPAALSLSSSSSSVSSFATSSHSRPSSTSSASSTSISATLPDSPLQPTTPRSAAMKLTLAPLPSPVPLAAPVPVSSASLMPPPTPTTPTHKTKKAAVIQSLASVLTRRWSNHIQQSSSSSSSASSSSSQQQESSSNQIECLSSMSHQSNTSSNGSMMEVVHDQQSQSQARELGRMMILGQGAASAGVSVPATPTTATAAASGAGSSDFIFSPRPCSPPLMETTRTRTFGEFYQALRMEG